MRAEGLPSLPIVARFIAFGSEISAAKAASNQCAN